MVGNIFVGWYWRYIRRLIFDSYINYQSGQCICHNMHELSIWECHCHWQGFFENVSRTSKNAEVRDVVWWCFPSKKFIGASVIFWRYWFHVVQANGMLKSKRPEFGCDDLWPGRHRMQKHGWCMGCDDTNVLFDHAVLPVGADATERMALATNIKVLGKVSRGEDTIIWINMFDMDIKTCSKGFVSFLGQNGFLGSCCFLEVAEEELAVVVSP